MEVFTQKGFKFASNFNRIILNSYKKINIISRKSHSPNNRRKGLFRDEIFAQNSSCDVLFDFGNNFTKRGFSSKNRNRQYWRSLGQVQRGGEGVGEGEGVKEKE